MAARIEIKSKTKRSVPEEPAEEQFGQRRRPDKGPFRLQVDRQTKESYATYEEAAASGNVQPQPKLGRWTARLDEGTLDRDWKLDEGGPMSLKEQFAEQLKSQTDVWQAQIKDYQEQVQQAGAKAQADYKKAVAQIG